MRKKTCYRLALAALTLLACLALAEAAARVRFAADVRLVRDPDHRLAPGTAETNADGIRSAREAGDFDAEGFNVVLLGDSFVYGYKMYRHLTLPARLEALIREGAPGLEARVANFGWPSSSPYLSLRLLKEIGKKYRPDLVVLCLDMTDFHDDLKYRHLIERDLPVYRGLALFPGLVTLLKKVLAELELDRLHEAVFGMPRDRFFPVNAPLGETRPRLAGTMEALGAIDRYAREELGAPFALVVLPRSFQYSDRECPGNWEAPAYEILGPHSREPFAFFDEVAPSLGYPVFSLLEAFEETEVFPTCLYDNPHWNEAGTALAARAVYDALRGAGLLPGE